MKTSFAVRASLAAILAIGVLAACSPDAPGGPKAAGAAAYQPRSQFSPELNAALPESIRKAGRATVVGEPGPPWRIIAPDGSVSGLQVDMLSEFSKILGVKFDTVVVDGLPAVKLGIQSGRYDIAFGPLVSTEATRKDLIIIDHSLGMPGFLYPSDGPRISSALDLCGKTIAHMSGSVPIVVFFDFLDPECVRAGKPPIKRLELGNFDAIMLGMKSRRADFAAASAHQATYLAAQAGSGLQSYVVTPREYRPDPLGMATSPKNAQLAKALYGAWKTVFENGAYAEITKKYHVELTRADQPAIHLDAAAN